MSSDAEPWPARAAARIPVVSLFSAFAARQPAYLGRSACRMPFESAGDEDDAEEILFLAFLTAGAQWTRRFFSSAREAAVVKRPNAAPRVLNSRQIISASAGQKNGSRSFSACISNKDRVSCLQIEFTAWNNSEEPLVLEIRKKSTRALSLHELCAIQTHSQCLETFETNLIFRGMFYYHFSLFFNLQLNLHTFVSLLLNVW